MTCNELAEGNPVSLICHRLTEGTQSKAQNTLHVTCALWLLIQGMEGMQHAHSHGIQAIISPEG